MWLLWLQKLSESEKECMTLLEANSSLAGHANTSQKILYMKKLSADYNELKTVSIIKYTFVMTFTYSW